RDHKSGSCGCSVSAGGLPHENRSRGYERDRSALPVIGARGPASGRIQAISRHFPWAFGRCEVSWHTGCDITGRQRGHAFTRDRISHTRHGAQRRAGRNVMELVTRLRALARDDEGQDLLEYALLVALIALVCVGAITAAGGKVSQTFSQIASAI